MIPPTIASMCCIRLTILAILFGLCTDVDVASGDEVEAWSALRAGRHVALMRHTDAPGTGDPPGFRIDDCATQRNLTAKGRLDAATIGSRLRAEGISVERIYSSPWCRCMDTAKLLALGSVEVEPMLGGMVLLNNQREVSIARARALIEKWAGSGILLLVTHGFNIQALTGISPASGEIVVVRSGSSERVGRLTLN